MSKSVEYSKQPFLYWHNVGLALFWAASMLTFRSSILLVGSANTPDSNTLVVVVSFAANMTVLFIISALVEKAADNLEKIPSWIFCAAILVGFVFIRIAGEPFMGDGTSAALIAGALLCGIGYGYFWGSWADVLGRVHPSTTTVSIPISYLLTSVLFVAITLGVSFAQVPGLLLVFPLPILSLLCLERCRRDESAKAAVPSSDPKRYIQAIASLVPLMIASLVLSCLFGFMWETTVLSTHTATEAHRLPLIANIAAAVVLIGAVLVARKKADLTLVYQILIPVSIVLFIAIPFFWHEQPVVLNAFSSAIYGVFDVIIWYLVASTSYDLAVSGFVVGGLVRGVSLLSRLIGIGIGYLVVLDSNVSNIAMIGLCIGAVYILAILLWFLYRNASNDMKAEAPDSSDSEAIAGADAADSAVSRRDETEKNGEEDDQMAIDEEEKFKLIAEDYGLTRREAEVLPYLARGRSAKVIAQALFVSEPTIRTHTRRILEKTCLHSKQDLIDLVEKYE